MKTSRPTRGIGVFEGYLANERARRANLLIPRELRSGRILDVGCGTQPYFLAHTKFNEKFAVDQLSASDDKSTDISWAQIDLQRNTKLPFPSDFFSVVTMLAVVEHLNPDKLVYIFRDVFRVLQPNGMFILTTPSAWSDNILRWMAKVDLVSKDEINEHVYSYTLPLIGWYFGDAGFKMENVKFGYFEMLLNQWATAIK